MIDPKLSKIQTINKTLRRIDNSYNIKNQQIQQLKENLAYKFKTKLINNRTKQSVYTMLSAINQNFLKHQQNINIMETYISQNVEKQVQKQKMNELKKWIKNPQQFESYYSTKLTKQSLHQVLNPKYELLKKLSILEFLTQKCGLKSKESNFKLNLVNGNEIIMGKILEKLEEIIILKLNHQMDQKIRILELMSNNLMGESDIKTINEYMESYVKLYESLGLQGSYNKFQLQQQTMRHFNFSISQTTVVLRNLQLNQHKHYQYENYFNEFVWINDGSYGFNNEYRPDYLCWEDINDCERSSNTMIGSEYFMTEKEMQDEDKQFQGRMVTISSFLKSDEKILLRLRLNSVEFDHITIKILKPSSSWERFIDGQRQSYIEFNLQIVPDQGDNRHTYGFMTGSSSNFGHKQSSATQFQSEWKENNDSSMVIQNENHLVLEDDVISLYLSTDENYFICWNETQNRLIQQVRVQKQKIQLIDNLPSFQLQLYAGIVLYSTRSSLILSQILGHLFY